MKSLKTVHDVSWDTGTTVLCRVAYDIGPKDRDGKLVVTDTARIEATVPTIEYLLGEGCKVILLTWVKRPGGKIDPKLSTKPHAEALSRLLAKPVLHVNDCIGVEVARAVDEMKKGDVLMLENVRFHPEEEMNDLAFASVLTRGADVIVFDAFAQAHREAPSTTGILQAGIPAIAGMLMERELSAFSRILDSPSRPLIAILGGAKISDKIETIKFLIDRVDAMLIGGALANTFLKGLGKDVGASMVESSTVDPLQRGVSYPDIAAGLLRQAPAVSEEMGLPVEAIRKLILPVDLIAADGIREDARTMVLDTDNHAEIPHNWTYLDIGPRTVEYYARILEKARTVFWNGPMGYFELSPFESGTRGIADAVIRSGAYSIVGGGDTETMIAKFGLEGKFNHVSTGGGVSLQILAGKVLPVVKYLEK